MSARASLIALSFLALLTTGEVWAATKATLTLTGPGGKILPVASLEGEERLSGLFRFIVAIPTTDPAAIPFDAFLGQVVTHHQCIPWWLTGVSHPAKHGGQQRATCRRAAGRSRDHVEVRPAVTPPFAIRQARRSVPGRGCASMRLPGPRPAGD